MFNISRQHRTQNHQLEERAKVATQMYRQGDVLLIRVKLSNDGRGYGRLATPAAAGVILAYGEATGHAHVLDPKKVEALLAGVSATEPATPAVWDAAAERWIRVLETTALQHLDLPRGAVPTGEHADIELEPGVYRVVRQREWDESMRTRYVSD